MIQRKEYIKTNYLIVGAGPAGLITGIGLLRLGFVVHIVERYKEQQRPVCGEYLSPQGVEYLRKLDLSHVLKNFNTVPGMTLYSSFETKVPTSFPNETHGVSLNRQVFQERLSEEFLRMGGSIHYDNQLEEIATAENSYKTITSNKKFEAEYLIGADGRMSSVARLLGFKTLPARHKRVALHCYLKPKTPIPANGQMHILPDGSYIGINPITEEEVNFSIVTNHEAIKEAGGLKELINFWLTKRKDLSEQFNLVTDEEIKTTAQLMRLSQELVQDRAVLIGDASGFIDPLTGEGMTTAIKTAAMLTEEIQKSSDIKKALKNYEHRRKNDFKEKEKLNHQFQSLIKYPTACEVVAQTLKLSERLRNTFIGIIGNVYTPYEGLKVIFQLYFTQRY